MKHWDLTPGETVTLYHSEEWMRVVFRFRTTNLAAFETLDPQPILRTFYLVEDGGLRERGGGYWKIRGAERNTRTIIRQPLGEKSNFTTGTDGGLRRAKRRAHRITRFALVAKGHEPVVRVTMDDLCQDELVLFLAALPDMLDEGNPDVAEKMQRLGRMEFARQVKIARGEETACIECGCSESRACSGGCVWARPNLCSRCV